jgi:ATP-dependent RNA helicase CshB
MFKTSIQEKINALGYKTFTPIQEAVFKAYPKEQHIIGLAPTGTGKTHAYLIPIVNELDLNYEAVQAVICVPTNELVSQVENMLKSVNMGFSVKAFTTSKDRLRELDALSKKQPQIVISTPGRLEDYAIKEGKLKIHTAKVFVLDEADMMLDMDFMTTLDRVFYAVRVAKMLLFSATLSEALTKWIDTYFGKAFKIDLKDPSVLKITHGLVYTRFETRDHDFKRLVKTIKPFLCMVFVSK